MLFKYKNAQINDPPLYKKKQVYSYFNPKPACRPDVVVKDFILR